ncbi:MAG: sigma-70 family RNA polymerase sigma factor [Planctomycetota bacterium]
MAARSGDRAAFARLYRRFAPLVHSVLLGAGAGRSEAEDLVQEVFTRALGAVESLRTAQSAGAWLCTIARRIAIDRGRKRVREPAPLGAQREPAARAVVEPPGVEGNEAERALAAIGELPEAYRETLILRLVQGLTGEQIAERTGMTPGSVRVNLHRGLTMLRERLGKEDAR